MTRKRYLKKLRALHHACRVIGNQDIPDVRRDEVQHINYREAWEGVRRAIWKSPYFAVKVNTVCCGLLGRDPFHYFDRQKLILSSVYGMSCVSHMRK